VVIPLAPGFAFEIEKNGKEYRARFSRLFGEIRAEFGG
jgi:hypothetical protein